MEITLYFNQLVTCAGRPQPSPVPGGGVPSRDATIPKARSFPPLINPCQLRDTRATLDHLINPPPVKRKLSTFQVVAFQAAMDIMASNFPGAFAGYTLKVTESHQSSKVDTSGTAKAIVEYFQKLGVKFNVDEVSGRAAGFSSFALFVHHFCSLLYRSPCRRLCSFLSSTVPVRCCVHFISQPSNSS